MPDEISYSRISTWKRCLKKYFYKYVEGLALKRKPSPPRMGSMVHEGILAKYKGQDWKEVVKEYWKGEIGNMPQQLISKDDKEELEIVLKVLERYFDHHEYFRHPDEKDLIEPETKFEVQIPNTDTKLIGYMDKVIEVPGEGIWLVDHKATTVDLDRKLENLELNEQIDYYTWALSKMFTDKKVIGTIWNGILLKLPTKPKPIKSGKRLSKRKMKTDYQTYYDAIIENGFDPADYKEQLNRLKNQDNPFFKTAWIDRDSFEMREIENELIQVAKGIENTENYFRDRAMGRCSWDCSFKDLCLTEKKGGDIKTIIDEYFEYYRAEREEVEEDEEKPF